MNLLFIQILGLAFLIFLSFSLPVVLHNRGVLYWKARATYHTLIFSSLGLSVILLRQLSSLLILIVLELLILLIHKLVTQKNPIRTLYDFMRREGVSQSQRGLYTVITNIGLLALLVISWNQPIYFALGMFVLAFADKVGEAVGRVEGENEYEIVNTKTIEGSVGVGITSLVVISVILVLSGNFSLLLIPYYLGVSLVITLVEAVSVKFLDNLLIPYTIFLSFYYAIPF